MAQKRAGTRRKVAGPRRWLACCTTVDDDGTEGSFQLIIDAPDTDEVVHRAKTKLKEMRASTTMFQKGCDVFLEYILDISGGDFSRPALVNYVWGSSPATKPVIFCDVPEQPDLNIDSYGALDEDDDDEQELEPLVSFKAKKSPKKRKRASSTPSYSSTTH